MGRRGPRPAPTSVKKARGVRPARINTEEPVPPVETPRCPKWLGAEAKRNWRRLAPGLRERGLLTVWEVDALAVLCEALARHRRATEELNNPDDPAKLVVTNNAGTPTKNPLVAIIRETEQSIRQYAQEFGLTPSARSTVKVEVPKKSPSVLQPVRDRKPA